MDRNTHTKLRDLHRQAKQTGNVLLQHAAGVALGEEDLVTTAAEYEARYGGGGLDSTARAEILAVQTVDDAIRMCVEHLVYARGRAARAHQAFDQIQKHTVRYGKAK